MSDTTELVLTRVFDAPRELVYRAFTDPDQVAAWFAPEGWSAPRDRIDIGARAGGPFHLTMVDDKDANAQSPINATFIEVVENELLLAEETVTDFPGIDGPFTMRMRLEFADRDGKTELTLRQGPFSPEMAEMTKTGWESSFKKLDQVLAA